MIVRIRAGFTLFEVGIAAILIALGILTLTMLLPIGIKAQQRVRFEIYAGTKALDMVEQFVAQGFNLNQGGGRTAIHLEAPNPWDSIVGYRSYSPDIETYLADVRSGVYPLPPAIAERLSSPNDEIRRILDAGGRLYYANPLPTHGIKPETSYAVKPPNEAMKLVFAVTGYAQQNAVPYLSWKAWPYYAPYPSPPMTQSVENTTLAERWEVVDDPDSAYVFDQNLGIYDGADSLAKDAPPDPDVSSKNRSGYWPYLSLQFPAPHTVSGSWHLEAIEKTDETPSRGVAPWLASKHYVALALYYAYRKGLPAPFVLGTATSADVDAHWDNPDHVRALRYLAHAGLTMTKWFPLEASPELPAGETGDFHVKGNKTSGPQMANVKKPPLPARDGLRTGVPIPGDEPAFYDVAGTKPLTRPTDLADLLLGANGGKLPAVTLSPIASGGLPGHFYVTHQMIVNWHEMSLALAMRFTAEKPYDWRVLRPLNRPIMMDHPLVQYDCFPSGSLPELSGIITGSNGDPGIPDPAGVAAKQWRPVAAVDNPIVGRNATQQVIDWTALRGDIRHFSLTAPFAPRERCRQIVFWSVDWQSYEDCETAPSAPVDASRYPRLSPGLGGEITTGLLTTFYLGVTNNVKTYGNSPTVQFSDKYQPLSRNPEKFMTFVKPMDAVQTGENIRWWTMGLDIDGTGKQDNLSITGKFNSSQPEWRSDDRWDYPVYLDPVYAAVRPDPRALFSGLYGADRNWNQLLDRGPVKANVRLRAVEVARFNIYDPRLALALR